MGHLFIISPLVEANTNQKLASWTACCCIAVLGFLERSFPKTRVDSVPRWQKSVYPWRNSVWNKWKKVAAGQHWSDQLWDLDHPAAKNKRSEIIDEDQDGYGSFFPWYHLIATEQSASMMILKRNNMGICLSVSFFLLSFAESPFTMAHSSKSSQPSEMNAITNLT